MKAITIKQPWASLIVHGIKDIENRTWACPKKYIGQRVLIHAGKERDGQEKPLLTGKQYDLVGGVSGYATHILGTRGAIIGSVEIVDCVINHPSIWAEKGVYNGYWLTLLSTRNQWRTSRANYPFGTIPAFKK